MDKDVEVKVDISGSEGATFEGSYSTIKEVKVAPHADNASLGEVRLFGDWLLRIRFTYTIKGIKNPTEFIPRDLLEAPFQEDSLASLLANSRTVFGKVPYDILPLDEIRLILRDSGLPNFIDIEFPPVESSIYNTRDGLKPFAKERIVWKRPKDFMLVDEDQGLLPPQVFQKQIEPNDIKQGILGDCWFMCALSSLAEMPLLVERLFITKNYNEDGLYRVKLCKNGEWVEVTLDDYFPCSETGGPIFSRSNGNELWVLLIEKAYAKLHGNYFTLRGGFAVEGMIDLTGSPTELFDFEEPSCQEIITNGYLF